MANKLMQVTMWTDRVDDLGIEQTIPAVINLETIRNIYPRKGGREGTRITFISGAGMAVKEPFHLVASRMGLADVPEYVQPPQATVQAPAQGQDDDLLMN